MWGKWEVNWRPWLTQNIIFFTVINYELFQKLKLIRNCEFNNLILMISLKYPISTITPTSWFPMLLHLIIMQTCLQFWADFCQSAFSLIDNNLALPALLNGLQLQLHLYIGFKLELVSSQPHLSHKQLISSSLELLKWQQCLLQPLLLSKFHCCFHCSFLLL